VGDEQSLLFFFVCFVLKNFKFYLMIMYLDNTIYMGIPINVVVVVAIVLVADPACRPPAFCRDFVPTNRKPGTGFL